MTDTVNLMPFTVRVEDGREFAAYAESAARAAARYESPTCPVVLVIRADEPFVRAKPKRHWILRLLIGMDP